MPPRGVKSSKRKRQYEHIKESAEKRGDPRAEEIAARTVNKQRAQAGETKTRGGLKTKRKASGRTSSSGGRKTSSGRSKSRANSSSRANKSSSSKKRSTGKSSGGRKK